MATAAASTSPIWLRVLWASSCVLDFNVEGRCYPDSRTLHILGAKARPSQVDTNGRIGGVTCARAQERCSQHCSLSPPTPPSTAAESPSAAWFPPIPPTWSRMGNGGPLRVPGNCIVAVGREPASSVDQFTVHCTNTASAILRWRAHQLRGIALPRQARARVGRGQDAGCQHRGQSTRFPHATGEGGLRVGARHTGQGVRADRMQKTPSRGAESGGPATSWWTCPRMPMCCRPVTGCGARASCGSVTSRWRRVPNTVPVNLVVSVPRADSGPDMSLATPVVPGANDRFIPPPPRWLALGDQGFELYDAGMDVKLLAAGQHNLAISCSFPIRAFIRHAFESPSYWGKRVRFSGSIKSENVEAARGQCGAGRQWPAWRRAVHGRHGHHGSSLPRHRDGHDGLDLPGTGHRHFLRARLTSPSACHWWAPARCGRATSSSRKCRAIHRSPRWPCPVVESREYQQVAGYTGRPARATPLEQ